MFLKLVGSLVLFAVEITASSVRSPVERLRYILEQIANLLPADPDCQSEQLKAEDRQSIIDGMVQFVQSDEEELETFVFVLSNAMRGGITATEIDTYKWDVISALMEPPSIAAEPSEFKKRTVADAIETEDDVSNKKSRIIGDSAEEIEMTLDMPQATTSEPTMVYPSSKPVANFSSRSIERLIDDLHWFIKQFKPWELRDPKWGYLRAVQGLRAANMDYAAIREDLNLMLDMRVSSYDIANIFSLAFDVSKEGLLAPIRAPSLPKALPKALVADFEAPLMQRLESFYAHAPHRFARDDHSDLSRRLAEYAKSGSVDRVTNALNIAILTKFDRQKIAGTFYKAFKALGGKY